MLFFTDDVGIDGLRRVAIAGTIYLWASGFYRFYRPFNCVRMDNLTRKVPNLILGLSLLAFTSLLAIYATFKFTITGKPFYSYLLLIAWTSSIILEIYTLNYLPALVASNIMKGGWLLALFLTLLQLTVKSVVAWAVDSATLEESESQVGFSLGNLLGNMAAAYTLLWLIKKSR
jgi:glucan phosphoethanolaminetransferase (alkaline phosphatase superfamily)